MIEDLLTLTHATERDVDLLLVEELVAGDAMLAVILREALRLSLEGLGHKSHRVAHSRRRVHNRREIDICVELDVGAQMPAMLLIENKIDADEQVKQSNSYAEEVKFLVESGRAVKAWSILVCPTAYAHQKPAFASGFDGVVHYEEIQTSLAQRARTITGELGCRLSHRAELLRQAIDKSRRGYVAVPLPVISTFNTHYVSLLRDRFPHLLPGPAMMRQGNPAESVTMIFAPECLPKSPFLPQTRLVHQLREANSNINFYEWGDLFGELAQEFAPLIRGNAYKLQPTINRRKSGRSGLMVISPTPKIDNQLAFEEQLESVMEGVRKAQELRQWFLVNYTALTHIGQKIAA